METNKWIIEQEQVGTRLDKFLLEQMPDVSRTRIQQWITDGDVLINQAISKNNYKVRLHDEITFVRPDDVEYDLTPVDMNLDVIYEVLVNKEILDNLKNYNFEIIETTYIEKSSN